MNRFTFLICIHTGSEQLRTWVADAGSQVSHGVRIYRQAGVKGQNEPMAMGQSRGQQGKLRNSLKTDTEPYLEKDLQICVCA